MKTPQVSIVTPSYEQREFLVDTLESVARQEHPSVEHVVVDGESEDGTVGLLEEYGKKHDHLRWISEPDNGQADAINKGFDMASGDIIGWLNSDDTYFDTGVLGRVASYFEKYDADVIYGDIALIDIDSKVLKIHTVPDFDYNKLRRYCFIEQPALFFDTNVLGGERLDTNLRYVMDYEFWLRLSQEYDFQHVSDILAADRNHAERKILKQRDAMQMEGREVVREYGGPAQSDLRYKMGRLRDILTSGIPRRGSSLRRTYALNDNDPKLAFDGRLGSSLQMMRNVFRQNRTLL